MFALTPCHVSWRIIERDPQGVILSDRELDNLVLNTGRDLIFRDLFAFSASAVIAFCAVGSSNTAATVTQDRLQYELIGNASRKTLTNTSGAALSASDIAAETTTISGCTYYKKLTVQTIYDTSDGNNGQIFNEYGLNTVSTLPANGLALSGIMFNRLVDPNPITKSASNTITVQITIRN